MQASKMVAAQARALGECGSGCSVVLTTRGSSPGRTFTARSSRSSAAIASATAACRSISGTAGPPVERIKTLNWTHL